MGCSFDNHVKACWIHQPNLPNDWWSFSSGGMDYPLTKIMGYDVTWINNLQLVKSAICLRQI